MARKRLAAVDSNQLFLFEEDRPVPAPPSQVGATPFFAQIMEEDAAIRRSFMSKEEYYRSPQWQFKRLQKIRLAGHACEGCGKRGMLEVHHKNYNSLYDELMCDLAALCPPCHRRADSAREYDSAFDTYRNKKYGEDAMILDPSDDFDEFNDWLDSKKQEDW